jgi:hypothetical protein
MRVNITEHLLVLFVSLIIFDRAATQCLYPAWEITCQKYCLDHKFYNIQMNQCWSKDPNNLRCKCNNQDFTEVIKAMFIVNTDENPIPNNPSLSEFQ